MTTPEEADKKIEFILHMWDRSDDRARTCSVAPDAWVHNGQQKWTSFCESL